MIHGVNEEDKQYKDSCHTGGQSDILRYEIVYKEGGIYLGKNVSFLALPSV
jgi:hypothetical protein